MKQKLFSYVVLWLVAIMPACKPKENISLLLVSPKTLEALPREVDVAIKVSPAEIVAKLERGEMHLYFFQKNMSEPSEIWRFNAKPDVSENGVFAGKVWLGGKEQGKDEKYVLQIIVSEERKDFSTGPSDIDVVRTENLPKAISQQKYFLRRGGK